jgi:LPXTG-motif cell wall-anchored protein
MPQSDTTASQATSTSTPSSSTQTAASDQNAANSANAGNLPQTASPLPLLGLLGFGSLVTGYLSRRKK